MLYTHIHPQYELYFCPEFRKQRSVINGREYLHERPCVIISTPYTLHSMCYLEDAYTPNETFVFYFAEKTLDAFGDRIIPKNRIKSEMGLLFEFDAKMAEDLRQIALKISDRNVFHPVEEREIYFALFLSTLFSIDNDKKVTQSDTEASYLQGVLKYISENFSQPIDSDFLAKKFSVSRSKLDRDFKRAAGCTPRDVIDNCRINLAKVLLLGSERLSVSEIARECGFSSETYFYPFFRKYTGESPDRFRKKAKS